MPSEIKLETSEQVLKDIDLKQMKKIRALYTRGWNSTTDKIKKLDKSHNKSAGLKKQELESLRKKIHQEQKIISKQIEKMILEHEGEIVEEGINETKKQMKQFGITLEGAFSHVKTDVIQSIASGKIYQGDWTLSKALWADIHKKQKDINEVVAQGILENKSAYDIAKDLETYVDPVARKPWDWGKVYPGTSKKIDYNAQRLARTMVNHGYQQSIIMTNKDNPFVKGIRWLASNSHRTCELCKQRARQNDYGLGEGVFPVDQIPMDHPNGLCSFSVLQDDLVDVADRLSKWAYGYEDKDINNWLAKAYPDKYNEFFPINNFVQKKFKEQGISFNQAEIDAMLKKALSYGKDLENMNENQIQKQIDFCLNWFSQDGSCAKELYYWMNIKGVQFDDAGVIKSYGKSIGSIKHSVQKKIKEEVKKGILKPEQAEVFESISEVYLKSLEQNEINFSEYKLKRIAEDILNEHVKTKERDAIEKYTGSNYISMNRFLRKQKGLEFYSSHERDEMERIQKLCKDAFSGLSKCNLEEDIVLRRGSDYSSLKGLLETATGIGDVNEVMNKMREGDFSAIPDGKIIVKDLGFMSTTPYSRGGFGGDVNYIINAQKGTQLLYVDEISWHKGEKEMLLNAGTNFLIEKIEQDGYRTNVFMKVVYQEKPKNI